jgi:hypothetical protein
MDEKTETTVMLRNGRTVEFYGKGVLGRILIGRDPVADTPITWHISGRWRWDDQDHSLDIVDGFTLERN